MRSRRCAFMVVCMVVLGVTCPCVGQESPGPRTLENLVNSGEAQETPAVEAEEADSGPKRPSGTVARPKNGVQHPDLDKAWAEYDAVVAKAAEGIKAAITKQFDAATEKGDLDAAEKWQAALDNFDKDGALPSGSETKVAVSVAVADYKSAKDDLSSAYEAVVKSLTMEKKIAEGKAARDEGRLLMGAEKAAGDQKQIAPIAKPHTRVPEGKYHMLTEDGHGLYFLIEGDLFILRGYHGADGGAFWQSPPAVPYTIKGDVLETPGVQFGKSQHVLQWNLRNNSAVRTWSFGAKQGRLSGKVRRLEWQEPAP